MMAKEHASYGVMLQAGMDKAHVVRHITEEVKSVLSRLKEQVS